MGNAAYEERRQQETDRRLAEEIRAQKRMARELQADELLDVMVPALKDFLEGTACLVVEPGPNDRTIIRFRRG